MEAARRREGDVFLAVFVEPLDPRAAEAARTTAAEARVRIIPLTRSALSARALRAPGAGIYKPWRATRE